MKALFIVYNFTVELFSRVEHHTQSVWESKLFVIVSLSVVHAVSLLNIAKILMNACCDNFVHH